ncbi:hypothetical protein VNO77_21959 [Canavalia gladiata]|uniref:Uncharacterized protein n=1 Tax=Canavalia gladiata TaxID=3824 RepID=A0AAN9L362_CANGL
MGYAYPELEWDFRHPLVEASMLVVTNCDGRKVFLHILSMGPQNFDPRHSAELLKYTSFNQCLFIIRFRFCFCFFYLNCFSILLCIIVNRHMDKQNEVLMETYRSMLNELQKLQVLTVPFDQFAVEEEMLMHKLYELMSVHGLTKKNAGNPNASNCSIKEDK